jgi:ferredoxin-NADP reductase
MEPPSSFNSKLIRKQKVSKDAFAFYFERPEDFEFLPGQYIKMTLDIDNPDERGISRFFSIASSPTEKDHILITSRIIESTFKKSLVNLKDGEAVNMRGPHGQFVLDEQETADKVFLTGGIGITPFRSMSVYARDKGFKSPITLIASFTNIDDLLFYEDLTAIISDRFKFIVTITHPEGSTWKGETGRIDVEKINKFVRSVKESVYYIAGPESMVTAMVELVTAMGVPEIQIKKENFPGY